MEPQSAGAEQGEHVPRVCLVGAAAPARRIIPSRLRPTATRTGRENLAPKKRRCARGAKTTKIPVMNSEFVGLMKSRPAVCNRYARARTSPMPTR